MNVSSNDCIMVKIIISTKLQCIRCINNVNSADIIDTSEFKTAPIPNVHQLAEQQFWSYWTKRWSIYWWITFN